MKHRCIRCKTVYETGNEALLKGCSCGSRAFVVCNADDPSPLDDNYAAWIERELLGVSPEKKGNTQRDVENVRIVQKGVFEIDVPAIAKNPVVVKDQNGIYYIRIKR